MVFAKFFTNILKLIKGNTVKDAYIDVADSFLNIDSDANVPNGYLKIDNNSVVDVGFIKDVSPVGKYLKDDGTWGFIPVSSSLPDGKILIGDSSNIAAAVFLSLNATPGSFHLSNIGVLTVPNAGPITRGLLSASDWVTFDGKQQALGYTPLNVAGGTMLGALVLNADAANPLEPVTYQQLIAWQTGLWDDRGGYDPTATSDYPATGGSGSSGAILKGDIWLIDGLGAGNTHAIGSKVVKDGDTIRSLINSPGLTDANWHVQPGDLGYTPLSNVLLSARIFVGDGINKAVGVIISLNATPGSFSLSNSGSFTFPNADASTRGLLSASDWVIFNGKQAALGYTPEDLSDKDIDSTFAANSDTKYPSQKAVKTALALKKNKIRAVTTITSSATPSPDCDTDEVFVITALAVTAVIAAPAGTPNDRQILEIEIRDNNSPQNYSFNAAYGFSVDLPAQTVTSPNKWVYYLFEYNATAAKWHCLGILDNHV